LFITFQKSNTKHQPKDYLLVNNKIIKTIMKIKDEKLEPYEIHYNENSYNVVEKKGLDKNGKQKLKTHAYCSSIENALKRIIRLQVDERDDVYSLKKYLKSIENANEQIKLIISK